MGQFDFVGDEHKGQLMFEEIQNGGALVSLSIQAGINPSVPFLLLWLWERFPTLPEADAMRFVSSALGMARAAGVYDGLAPGELAPEESIPTVPGIGVGYGTTERYIFGMQITVSNPETGESKVFPIQVTSGKNLTLGQIEDAGRSALQDTAAKYPRGFKGVMGTDSTLWDVQIVSVVKGQ